MHTIATILSLNLLSITLTLAQAPQAASSTSLTTRQTGAVVKSAGKSVRVVREIPDTYKGRVILVGSGGGVVGKETTYSLLDDGRLFSKKTGEKTHTYIGKQTAANTKKVFWSVEDRCAIKKTKYQKPGNLYRFVGWRKGREAYKVSWAPGDKTVPANYEQVYKGFIGMLPKS
ncbi:FAD-binding oxidoreductase [Fibrella sp. WM1]|uniref:FAD-binding oxidoreductase n=1 Tax=Fibrella musci TaxID=3242485 RepID=UPI0035202872